ncbi:hypothetical protein OS122_29995 [Mycolicibacterium mucogenicum]|uniref:hypothetical protein n=1 Tax=Mycolicibacterium mucogenicum TaxID=56689 RepID=UPI00226A98CC|nr:hypothetical protein [Mycolicibacterium mucogenicum]MCX8565119.1 hypothetical protein [Mycolicibacterium mucogenicum]
MSIQSPGSEAMHRVHRELAQEARLLSEANADTARVIREQINVLNNVAAQHANIDKSAHEQINQTPVKAAIPQIVATHHASARLASTRGVASITAMDAKWSKNAGAIFMGMTKLAPAPGPISPPPSDSPGITRPLDTKVPAHHDDENRPRKAQEQPPQPQETGSGPSSGQRTPGSGQDGLSGADKAQPGTARPEYGSSEAQPIISPTPATSRPSISPMSGGGIPSTGGGGGAGGLGSGLGSQLGGGASPLSSMMGGLGQNPASGLGSGLSSGNPAAGLANSGGGSAAAANPGAAFAKGLSSTGSAIPPVASTVAPPPAAASPVPPAQTLGAGVGGPSGVGAPAGAAGVHVAPAGIQAAPPVMSGGAAAAPAPSMMLPSTGMGNPAAPGGAVMPMGSNSAPAGAPGAAPASAGPVAANTGATLVPAAVVSSALTARPQKLLSQDAQAAAALAWQLQHACRMVSFPIDWAVGVFRSGEGSETVVMSAEGSGYVPAGVYLPRGVRLLAADVDDEFRRLWFGWRDPAEVMVEYARQRQASGWQLAAAASTGPIAQFRDFGTEYADQCTFERSPLSADDPIPVLDDMHVHRLQLEASDLYDRLLRLVGAQQIYVDRVVIPVAGELVEAAKRFEHPDELQYAWATLTGGGEPTAEQWALFANVTATQFLSTQLHRPEAAGSPQDWKTAVYRDNWTVSRALEVLTGWASRPLPVADMAYAAITVDPGSDVRERISASLQQIEVELGWV